MESKDLNFLTQHVQLEKDMSRSGSITDYLRTFRWIEFDLDYVLHIYYLSFILCVHINWTATLTLIAMEILNEAIRKFILSSEESYRLQLPFWTAQ